MDTRELESAPSLGPLYAKAAAGAIGGRGDSPPGHAYELGEAQVDPDEVASYSRVCGFRLGGELPPTYPHVLAFPLAMTLMTERSFPFKLMGLVHLANRIEQSSPIPLGASPSLRVWAENLRPHHRGRQIDVVGEARVEGERVWSGRSTYLSLGKGQGSKPPGEADPLEGVEPSAEWDVPGDIGRRYAAVSGDRNPIHLHPITARVLGFPSAIAHGMWTYARSLASLESRLAPAHTSRVEFRAPLRIPGRASLLSAERNGGWDLALDSPGGERRHLQLRVDQP